MLSADQLHTLARYARRSIEHALGGAAPERPSGGVYEEPRATFVTLRRGERLQGCIGSLQAKEKLADDVREHALAAAFRDDRGQVLGADDVDHLSVEVSVLGELEPMAFLDEDDALAQLRPGRDGVLLTWHDYRATFLPQVWDSLPDRHTFMARLKEKAGLPANFWAHDVQLSRYGMEKGVDHARRAEEAHS